MRKKISTFKKNLNLLNQDRKKLGMKELIIRKKNCNKCGGKFETITHDICCPTCRRTNN